MFRPSGTYTIEGYNSVGVFITPLALQKMSAYVRNCQDEIGWLGEVVRVNNTFLIVDTLLFKQEVHSATTEISPDDLIEVAEEILAQENGMERYQRIKMWGHSHVNMGVNPSGQDESQMRTFENGNEYFIRIIANKKGEMRVDVYDYVSGVIYRCVKWEVYSETVIDEEAIKAEIEAKVKKKVFATYTGGYASRQVGSQGQIRTTGYGMSEMYGWDEDWYDRAYQERVNAEKKTQTVKENQKVKVVRTTKVKSDITQEVSKASDLIEVLGFTEDEIMEIAYAEEFGDVIDIVYDTFINADYTDADLKLLKELADEYVLSYYGAK